MKDSDIDLLEELVRFILKKESADPVITPTPPDALRNKMDLQIEEEPLNEEDLLDQIKSVIAATPKTSSDKFFNQLFGGRNAKAAVAEMVTVMLNNSMYTYKVGGPMVLLENEIVNEWCKLANYPEGSSGTMAPGGSLSNFMGMIMARDNKFPEIRSEGNQRMPVMYASKECHYSVRKNAAFMGIGTNNLRFVDTDAKGALNPEQLEAMILEDIDEGKDPFLVLGTAGTTVMGAVDPIDKIADITEKYNLWFHLDAAFYGSILLSETHRQKLKGIDRTDSYSFNAHKLFSIPLSCSFILTKHKACLYQSFNSKADYLFQADSDDYNPGKVSLQCGRRNDAFKFWVMWKSLGSKGMSDWIDKEFELSQYAREYVLNHPDYTLYSPEGTLTLCFNYKDIPPRHICNALNDEGEMMVGYGKFKDNEFIRLAIVNATNDKEVIHEFFKTLEAFANAELAQEIEA